MSTLVDIPGRSTLEMNIAQLVSGNAVFNVSNLTMSASGTKIAKIGPVWKDTRPAGAFNLRKIGYRTGTVSINAASVIRHSFQDLSLTAGPPYQPDGTPDQTADLAGSAFTSNTWVTTGNFSADRSVVQGEIVCVVWEFQTFTAADSFVVAAINDGGSAITFDKLLGGNSVINTGSWSLLNAVTPNIVFECDDGSPAYMEGGFTLSAITTVSIANNITARAGGVLFTVPAECKVERFMLNIAIANGADGSFILYDGDGTTALKTWAIDNDAVANTTARSGVVVTAPITLQPSTNYRFVFVPSTTTATSLSVLDVASAGFLTSMPWAAVYTQRDSGGSWTETSTRVCIFGMGISAIHNGAGGGGVPYVIGA